jgi:formylglycine-generating enzyme required for sulfatase activity
MKNLLVLFFSIGFLNVAYTQSEAVNPSSTYNIETKYEPSILDKVVANGKKIVEPEMVFVEGGTFQMGSSTGEADEQPVHFVTLSSFNIGKYEVTQALWMAVMGNNPSQWDCDNCPVNSVSWDYVQDFISKLNAQTGKNYRLPTEAEWEYAAKGGKQSRSYTYSGSNNVGSVAWYYDNSENKTHKVGGKQGNELGIYDMSGNVWELCSDWYGPYSSYNETNSTGASSGRYRVLRGGSEINGANYCRSAFRLGPDPGRRSNCNGFRLVLPVED